MERAFFRQGRPRLCALPEMIDFDMGPPHPFEKCLRGILRVFPFPLGSRSAAVQCALVGPRPLARRGNARRPCPNLGPAASRRA